AVDMARFMIAHLQLGRLGESRILKEETAARMHSRVFTHDPRLDGMCYGFMESRHNGYRIIGHGGDTELFHTSLLLLPDQQVGFFVSCNSEEGGQPRTEMGDAFLDRYFPDTRTPRP